MARCKLGKMTDPGRGFGRNIRLFDRLQPLSRVNTGSQTRFQASLTKGNSN